MYTQAAHGLHTPGATFSSSAVSKQGLSGRVDGALVPAAHKVFVLCPSLRPLSSSRWLGVRTPRRAVSMEKMVAEATGGRATF